MIQTNLDPQIEKKAGKKICLLVINRVLTICRMLSVFVPNKKVTEEYGKKKISLLPEKKAVAGSERARARQALVVVVVVVSSATQTRKKKTLSYE
jgi:hypothetical protein